MEKMMGRIREGGRVRWGGGKEDRERGNEFKRQAASSLAIATCDELDLVWWFDGLNLNLLVQSTNLKTPMFKPRKISVHDQSSIQHKVQCGNHHNHHYYIHVRVCAD